MNVVSLDNREQYVNQLEDTVELYQERIAELEFAQEDLDWIRVGGEPNYEFSRDFLRRIIARSRLFFLMNPLINRAVTLQADYVFAQGLNMQGSNQFVNAVIQEFRNDVKNQQSLTSHKAMLDLEQTLIIDGNLFFVLFTDKLNTGKVQVRTILVDEIKQIICNPDDSSDVWFYRREWIPVDDEGNAQKERVAYYPDIDYMPIKDLKLPKTRKGIPIYWDAPIVHVKTGSLQKSKFGIPETYSALPWAKAHSKMLEDWATIISTYARFAFNWKVAGNKRAITSTQNRLSTTVGNGSGLGETNPTAAGSIVITRKDGDTLEAVKTSGATTSAKDARELRIMIAAAMGLPDPMLSGEVDVGNLATAKTLDRPTELKFRSRQKFWEGILLKILLWVERWAIEANNGLLTNNVKVTFDSRGTKKYAPKKDSKTGKPIDLHLEVVFPPILEKTISDRIDAIIGAVTLNGKTFAIDSPELRKITIRLTLQALGLSDVDELVERIFEDMNNADLKDDPNGTGTEPERQPVSV